MTLGSYGAEEDKDKAFSAGCGMSYGYLARILCRPLRDTQMRLELILIVQTTSYQACPISVRHELAALVLEITPRTIL